MKILHFCWTTLGNKITYWKKWPSRLRVNQCCWSKGLCYVRLQNKPRCLCPYKDAISQVWGNPIVERKHLIMLKIPTLIKPHLYQNDPQKKKHFLTRIAFPLWEQGNVMIILPPFWECGNYVGIHTQKIILSICWIQLCIGRIRTGLHCSNNFHH